MSVIKPAYTIQQYVCQARLCNKLAIKLASAGHPQARVKSQQELRQLCMLMAWEAKRNNK